MLDPSGHGPARAVRVLVAQAAEPPARLSALLEDAGHRVVARASTPGELARLVGVAGPEVVVFDAEISAETVAAFRVAEPDIGVVVVWPEGATSVSAHERVSPVSVRRDLARAVLRAAPARPVPIAVGSSAVSPLRVVPRSVRRGGVEVAVAATLTFLLVVSAVASRLNDQQRDRGLTDIAAAAPPASGGGTVVTASPPVAPSGPVTGVDSGPTTGTAGDPGTSPSAPVTAPGTSVGGSTATAPTATAPTATAPTATAPARVSPVSGNTAPVGMATGPMLLARERACRSSTARLGIAGAEPALQRLVTQCVSSDAAGLLRALVRLVLHDRASPGRGSDHRPGHRGGNGGAAGHGAGRRHGPGEGQSGPRRPNGPRPGEGTPHGPHGPPRHGPVAGHPDRSENGRAGSRDAGL
ncbi:MAG: hypothetical protein ABI635_08695 [Actinomycetota bacterium]